MGSYSYLGTNYPFSFLGAAVLSASISAAITASGHPYIGWTKASIRARGARWQMQYRKYLSQAPPRAGRAGIWRRSFRTRKCATTSFSKTGLTQVGIDLTNRNYNLLFGHQRVFGQHFTFDVFTGVGYREKTHLYR